MSPRTQSAEFQAGVRASITWLHEEAKRMNDPHARSILNDAAFHLGVNKPVFAADLTTNAELIAAAKRRVDQAFDEQYARGRDIGLSDDEIMIRRLADALQASEARETGGESVEPQTDWLAARLEIARQDGWREAVIIARQASRDFVGPDQGASVHKFAAETIVRAVEHGAKLAGVKFAALSTTGG